MMLTKPSPMALKALYSFSNHTGWSAVEQFLNGELLKIYENLARAPDEVTLRQLQGRAQVLTEFLDLVQHAPDHLKRLGDTGL